MAMRTVTWIVGSDGTTVTPTIPQNGGVQGEENATVAVFRFAEGSPLLEDTLQLYVECIDNAGGYDKTPPLAVEDGQVSVPVPLAWTQYGGISTLRLVGERDGQIVYTLEGRLRFASRQTAARQVDGLLRTHIQQTLNEVETAAVTAEVSAAQAADSAAAAKKVGTAASNDAEQAHEANDAAQTAAASAESSAQVATEAARKAELAATCTEAAEEARKVAQEALEKSREADAKYEACVSATQAATQAAENANEVKEGIIEGGYIESLKELNNGAKFRTWIGTQAEYDVLETKPNNTLCIITDDRAKEDIEGDMEDLKAFQQEQIIQNEQFSNGIANLQSGMGDKLNKASFNGRTGMLIFSDAPAADGFITSTIPVSGDRGVILLGVAINNGYYATTAGHYTVYVVHYDRRVTSTEGKPYCGAVKLSGDAELSIKMDEQADAIYVRCNVQWSRGWWIGNAIN